MTDMINDKQDDIVNNYDLKGYFFTYDNSDVNIYNFPSYNTFGFGYNYNIYALGDDNSLCTVNIENKVGISEVKYYWNLSNIDKYKK